MTRKHDDPMMAVSEPHLLFSIMDRHTDWAVMICLVGLGHDIYDGEVGMTSAKVLFAVAWSALTYRLSTRYFTLLIQYSR